MAADMLTEKEVEALALVGQGYTSKEIALKLKISPASVDQRVDGARRKLGGVSRLEAARRFSTLHDTPERLIYEPSLVTPESQLPPSPASPQDDLLLQDAMFDERAVWDRGSLWRRPHLVPADLGKAGRMLVMLAMALLTAMVLKQAADLSASLGSWFPS